MADIKDINVFQTVTSVSFEVEPNTDIININKITIVGSEGGVQDLQSVTDVGATTTNPITANSFIKSGGTGLNALLDNGSTVALSAIGGATNLSPTQTATNFTINSDTGTDATIPLGNGTLAGATLNDYTTTEKNKLAGIQAGAEVNVNADWNAVSGDAQILNKPTGLATVTYVDTQDATKENSLGNPLVNGYVLSSTTGGVRSWVAQSGGGGGSATLQNSIASGTDIYTATIAGVTSYVDGAGYLIRFTNGNTQTCSININGLGARTLYRNNDGQLIGGDIQDEGEMLLVYSSALSAFKCIGTSPNDIIAYVTNAESITITKGQPVYAFGGVGDRMTVKLAYNTLDVTSAQTVGLVMSTSIAAGQKGYIIMQGLLDNLSTLSSPFIDGDTVYLGATAGTITRVKPSAPNHLVYLGIVTTSSAGAAGRMYVKPQNGYELDELHDVALTNPPTNNDGLFYELSTDLWKNKSIATVLGYTPANDASVVHLAGNETISGLKTFTDNLIAGRYLYSGGSIFPEFGQTFYINANGATHSFGGGISNVQNNLEVPNGTLKIGLQTASTIASFDANKNVVSLTTANGYPTLTELKSLVGVSATAIQTQLNGKQPINANLTSISNLSTTGGVSFVRVYNGAYYLDNGNYLTSVGISDLTATGTPSATTYLRGDNTWSPITTPSQGAYTVLANNTNASAVPTEQIFRNEPSKAYTGTITPSATTAPTGTTNHTYSWCQVGDLVTIRLNLDYASAGTGVTSLACMLPSDCPNPEIPSGVSTALNVISYGVGTMAANKASVATMGTAALRLKTTGPNTFDIQIQRASGSYATAYATIQYFV